MYVCLCVYIYVRVYTVLGNVIMCVDDFLPLHVDMRYNKREVGYNKCLRKELFNCKAFVAK